MPANAATISCMDDQGSAQAPGRHERIEQIRRRVIDSGFMSIEALAESFGVSAMTIHRDLGELERQGWLQKVRGGATARSTSRVHGDVRQRMTTMTAEKEALARAAVKLVQPGSSVILDESTTALPVAQWLPAREPVTVITHFLSAIRLLAGQPGIELIALGGEYMPAYDAFFGKATTDAIAPLRADLLLMSTTAISDAACHHETMETVRVKHALMQAAASKVLLADHTKFERRALHHLAPLTAFDLVLVDDGLDAETLADLRERGVPVRVVSVVADAEVLPLTAG
jgi:DeoR/GlpR family transcriptional regulator of sugar metabolism